MGVSAQGVSFTEELYEFTPLYYGGPCQVRYYNSEKKAWRGGIVYQDFIIDGETGERFLIEDVVADAVVASALLPDNVIVELAWIDLSDTILGNS